MVGAKWKGTLVAAMIWAGTTWGQAPESSLLLPENPHVITVEEAGHKPRQCRVLKMWCRADGSAVFDVKDAATGERLTVVEKGPASNKDGNATAKAMTTRIYHWKRDVPPPDAPVPPPGAAVALPPVKPGVRNQGSGVRNQGSGIGNPGTAASWEHLRPEKPPKFSTQHSALGTRHSALGTYSSGLRPPASSLQPMRHSPLKEWSSGQVIPSSYPVTPSFAAAAISTVERSTPPKTAAAPPKTAAALPSDWRQSWGKADDHKSSKPALPNKADDHKSSKPDLPYAEKRPQDPLLDPLHYCSDVVEKKLNARMEQSEALAQKKDEPRFVEKLFVQKKEEKTSLDRQEPKGTADAAGAPRQETERKTEKLASEKSAPAPKEAKSTPSSEAVKPNAPIISAETQRIEEPRSQEKPKSKSATPKMFSAFKQIFHKEKKAPAEAPNPAVPVVAGAGSVFSSGNARLGQPIPASPPQTQPMGVPPAAMMNPYPAQPRSEIENAFTTVPPTPQAPPMPPEAVNAFYPRPVPPPGRQQVPPANAWRVANAGMQPTAPPAPAVSSGMQLVGASASSVEQLLDILRKAIPPSHREWAADRLSAADWRANPVVVDALVQAARGDPVAMVRAACVRSLGKMNVNTLPVVEALQAQKQDKDPEVRRQVEETLLRFAK